MKKQSADKRHIVARPFELFRQFVAVNVVAVGHVRRADDAGDTRKRQQAERTLDVDDALAGFVLRDGRRRESGAFCCRRHMQNGA